MMMRVGLMVAAAAAMMFAVPASAQRYYQFEVHGIADVLGIGPNGQGYRFDDTIDLAFDTSSGAGSYLVSGTDLNGGTFSATFSDPTGSTTGTLSSMPQPGGPVFSFGFPLSSITSGTGLQSIPTSNTAFAFDYKPDARYSTTVNSSSGQILSVTARTSDTAPASLGASEQIVMSVLPEPASWTMMILGVGLVGGVLRRRRTSDSVTKAGNYAAWCRPS